MRPRRYGNLALAAAIAILVASLRPPTERQSSITRPGVAHPAGVRNSLLRDALVALLIGAVVAGAVLWTEQIRASERSARAELLENTRFARELAISSPDGPKPLGGLYLVGAALNGLNLKCADLAEADLSGADLSGANLFGADLSGADLAGANLSHANLTGAFLVGARLDKAQLTRATVIDADFSSASLVESDLFAADISGAFMGRGGMRPEDLGNESCVGIRSPRDVSFLSFTDAPDITGIELGCVTWEEEPIWPGVRPTDEDGRGCDDKP